MQRLAALVPHARLHLIHGALAPHAGLCAAIARRAAQNTSEPPAEHTHRVLARMGWARLLKRVFNIDMARCPHCGDALRIIAALEEPAVIVKILTHLGLPATLTGAAAGVVPGDLTLTRGTVLQPGRRSGSAGIRASARTASKWSRLGTS
jgi:hypothetical protein